MKNKIDIKVADFKENPDGSADVVFDLDDATRENLVTTLGWPEWSDERFQNFVILSLKRMVAEAETEDSTQE